MTARRTSSKYLGVVGFVQHSREKNRKMSSCDIVGQIQGKERASDAPKILHPTLQNDRWPPGAAGDGHDKNRNINSYGLNPRLETRQTLTGVLWRTARSTWAPPPISRHMSCTPLLTPGLQLDWGPSSTEGLRTRPRGQSGSCWPGRDDSRPAK